MSDLVSWVRTDFGAHKRTTTIEQKPTVGRTVHYQAFGTPGGEHPSVPRAAIITDVHDAATGDVSVCVLNPTGIFFNRVKYSAEAKPGCWNWPPRA